VLGLDVPSVVVAPELVAPELVALRRVGAAAGVFDEEQALAVNTRTPAKMRAAVRRLVQVPSVWWSMTPLWGKVAAD